MKHLKTCCFLGLALLLLTLPLTMPQQKKNMCI